MLSEKQKKIASRAGNPNKIDAKDFAVLKAEKAKGRGMGLEDEKLEPGKEYIERAKGGMTKGQKKVGKVMREFKAGKLHSGKKGPVVKNPKQAIAIALSEAGMSKKKMMTGDMVKAEEGKMVTKDDTTEYVKRRKQLAGIGTIFKKMGGGMMYAKGGSVQARGAKLGRTRPTKLL